MSTTRKKIVNIHSSVENKQPLASALEYGEIAINYAKDKEFISFKNADDEVVRVSTDDILNKRMESKEVIPVSGSVTNIDKENNKSELVIKMNQWVGEGTPNAHDINYGTDSKGVDIAPGFAVDMSAFALNGGNGNFESMNVKCSTTLEGTTRITGSDSSHSGCGNALEVTTKDTSINGDNLNIVNNSGMSITNKDVFTISGKTLNIKEENFNLTGNSTFNGNTVINGNATVTGNTSLKATTVDGPLGVTGESTLKNTTVNGTLNVTGGTTLQGVTVQGNAKLNSASVANGLSVSGSTSLKSTTVDGTLGVTGESTLKNTTVNGAFNVTGNSVFNGNATVTGNTSLKSTTVDGTLNVTGATTLQGVTAQGEAKLNSASVTNGLSVSGSTSLKTVNVNGSLNTTGPNNLSGNTFVQSGDSMYNLIDLIGYANSSANGKGIKSLTFTGANSSLVSETGQTLTVTQTDGKVVAAALQFDNKLDASSVNAVQNKVVYEAYEELDCGKMDTSGLTGDSVISVTADSCRTAQISHKIGANAYSGGKLTVIETDAYGHITGLREATNADFTTVSAELKDLNIMYGATTSPSTGSFTRDNYTPYNGSTSKNLVVPQKVSDLEGGSAVENNITSLQTKVSSVESNVTAISGNVNTISGSVSTLSNNVTNISNKVDTVSGSVTTLQGSITNVNNSVTALTQTVSTIQTSTEQISTIQPILSAITITGDTNNQTAPTLKDGQTAVIIYKNTGSSDATVSISSTGCSTPNGGDLTLTAPAGGYCEVNYLRINGETFLRGA